MKRLMIVSLAVLCAAILIPQELSAQAGIKAGYSWSSFYVTSPDEVPPFQTQGTPMGGVFFNLGLGFLSFQPELLYVRMGGRIDLDETTSLEYRLDYVQVPLLLKLNIIPAGPIRPFVYGGVYGSYLFNAKGVVIVDGDVTDDEDMDSVFENFDYGILGGAGVGLKLSGILITAEARYNYGLANLPTNPGPDSSLKNSCWMALVGVAF